MDISFEMLNHASRANSAGGADRLEREIRSHVTTQRKFGVNSEVMTDSRIRSNTSRPPAMQRPLVRRPLRWVNTPSLLPPPALRRIASFDSSRPRGCADLATPGRRNTLLATHPALQPIAPTLEGPEPDVPITIDGPARTPVRRRLRPATRAPGTHASATPCRRPAASRAGGG